MQVARLAHRRAAEFAAPDDQRVVQQAALLQVLDQRGGRADRPRGNGRRAACRGRVSGVAVVVPVGVIELHEADAALDQPPGQQAVVGERRLARLGAVRRPASACVSPDRSISSGALVCMR